MTEDIKRQIADNRALMGKVEADLVKVIKAVADSIIQGLSNGKKLLIMGNGGSAADAQHFAAEITGRFKMERPGLPAIALTTDTSAITAIGNDYGFDEIFSRQVQALACKGDIVFGISTSGNSENVIKGLNAAQAAGAVTIALLGKDGGKIKDIAELSIVIPSSDTPRIQEAHIMIIHILCDLLEKEIFGKGEN
ncbi:MAG: D-sedoheptulose 7-phosphate isomerase [Desulfuromonadales bacterium]|nr:D-sedoheptulose 7-phosphate isomerase [Desulfuromonadales bacterium]